MTGTITERLPAVGAVATLQRTISVADIEAFAALSGDRNPLHVDPDFARRTRFQRPVAHGMLVAGFVSTMVGMQLPGAGALWTQQSFEWKLPVYAGDTLAFTLRVRHASHATNTVAIEVNVVNQNGRIVMEGEGAVMVVEQTASFQQAKPRGAALVTGASRGIGAAVATTLAEAGFAVGINYLHSRDQADELCCRIRETGGQAVTLEADVTRLSQVRDASDRLQQASGRPVTVLVHCASLPVSLKPFLESGWEEAQHAMDVQVQGAWNCAQALLPKMIANEDGSIVFLGSAMTAAVPPSQWTAFLLAKSALHSLMRSLAAEFGPAGIRVNMVSPGMTNTATVSAISERLRKVQAMQAPLRRTIGLEEVAETVAFLCSANASALTGIDVPVCGGAVMR